MAAQVFILYTLVLVSIRVIYDLPMYLCIKVRYVKYSEILFNDKVHIKTTF